MMCLIPPLIWHPIEKEEERMNEPEEDFDGFLKKKEDELKKKLNKLEEAFDFFRWWRQVPDGGRIIYFGNRASEFYDDVKKEREKPLEETLSYSNKDFALKINKFQYVVVAVKRKASERVRNWSVETKELPEEFRD